MTEIREHLGKALDDAARKYMAGDIAIPRHLAFKIAMKASELGAEEVLADLSPTGGGRPAVVDSSFVDVYSRLAMQFIETMPSDEPPDIVLCLACSRAQHVIAAAVDFARTLHDRLG